MSELYSCVERREKVNWGERERGECESTVAHCCDILRRETSLILMQFVRFSSLSWEPAECSMMYLTPKSDTL